MAVGFAGELIEREAFAHDAPHSNVEPLAIGQLPIVKAIRLLIKVPEQVEWFDTDIGSVDSALQ